MMDYKGSGVDVEAGYKSVELMKKNVEKTFRSEVLGSIGGFGGLFQPNFKGIEEPVLVSGTDGVGTKLKIAFLMDRHSTIGIDCVAMCVNDIICTGGQPLFFMDYIALGKNVPERVAEIVKGVSDGCLEAGCALVGGETAEMPGMYENGEYDIAGFAVGVVDKKKIIDGKTIKEGDKIIGLASSGLHSNGYSLVRKIFNINNDSRKLNHEIERLGGKKLGDELLVPTKIYVKTIHDLLGKFEIKGIANITGGGFYENIPRALPKDFAAKIKLGSWNMPPIFDLLRDMGELDEKTMYNTFNLGIGMVVVVSPEISKEVLELLNKAGEEAFEIGEIVKGKAGVELC